MRRDPGKRDVRTVHLGQYTHEHADAIAGRLEEAGIFWWVKVPGLFSQVWERSVRVFVDRDRLEEARRIADEVLAADQTGGGSGQS